MPKGIYKRSVKELDRIKQLRIGKEPWNKGKVWSFEVIEKFRKARLRNPISYWKGKNRSVETKLRISKTRIERKVALANRNPNWKGGKKYDREYKMIEVAKGIYKSEHRLIIKKKLGLKRLFSKLIVHHKDGNKRNNDPNNLELLNRTQHINLHLHAK